MTGFGIIIGGCKIVPASPKLAMLLVAWMFGVYPTISYDEYKNAYAENGGKDQIEQIEKCFLDWAPDTIEPNREEKDQ